MPAKAGIQAYRAPAPAFAGVTEEVNLLSRVKNSEVVKTSEILETSEVVKTSEVLETSEV